MCGLVGTVGDRNLLPVLLDGLQRLEYRGYDSAGIALLDNRGELCVRRTVGPVEQLVKSVQASRWKTHIGIGHTRWATHGKPSETNAHPHVSGDSVAVVHNGIIENQEYLRLKLAALGYRFSSDTDTEVIAHNIAHHLGRADTLLDAVRLAVNDLEGSYAIAVISRDEPQRIVAARRGSPLLIGLGNGENLLASDLAALLPVTNRFVVLEDGDVAELNGEAVYIVEGSGRPVSRREQTYSDADTDIAKGPFVHFMHKEIFAQPQVLESALEGRIEDGYLRLPLLEPEEGDLLSRVRHVHLVGCGTSYHAALVARYLMESLSGCSCMVELASEYRYRSPVVPAGTLFVAISQSGETADTLAALREARNLPYLATVGICNVPYSSLVREADHALLMRAGAEIGVASTKAFTAQLMCLFLVALAIVRQRNKPTEIESRLLRELLDVPLYVGDVLAREPAIKQRAAELARANHAIFLGRRMLYPIALEGALKLKEISYIHAEGYAGGELKHGPLALVDERMPVIALVPSNRLQGKMIANLEEVEARGARLIVLGDDDSWLSGKRRGRFVSLPACSEMTSPFVYAVAQQLLAYHAAVMLGNDVDKPRNLAKSVTVE